MCVNNLPRVVREAERPGLKPATYWSQVRCPNHHATTTHYESELDSKQQGRLREIFATWLSALSTITD